MSRTLERNLKKGEWDSPMPSFSSGAHTMEPLQVVVYDFESIGNPYTGASIKRYYYGWSLEQLLDFKYFPDESLYEVNGHALLSLLECDDELVIDFILSELALMNLRVFSTGGVGEMLQRLLPNHLLIESYASRLDSPSVGVAGRIDWIFAGMF